MPTLEELIVTKPMKDPYMRAYINIMYTGVWLQQNVSQVLKPFGITEPQYNVLRILRGQKGAPMNLYEIQDRMIQKMSNVSRLIDKLLIKGLVERNECESNRRRVNIVIKEAGLKLLEDIEQPLLDMLNNVSKNITDEEAKLVGDVLDKLRNE